MEKAEISGNLDAPEGGFDAIVQALACNVSDTIYRICILYCREPLDGENVRGRCSCSQLMLDSTLLEMAE